jgi:hypothetical protein
VLSSSSSVVHSQRATAPFCLLAVWGGDGRWFGRVPELWTKSSEWKRRTCGLAVDVPCSGADRYR